MSPTPAFFLFLSALSLTSLLPAPAAARGGENSSELADFVGHMKGLANRHLLKENIPQIPEEVTYGYMSNLELEKAMKEFSQRCSNISRIYSIGQSVNGFPLWVIEISDKPGQEEAEPAFKFIGNVHGDEPVGRELLIRLANWLCDNYVRDPLATMIIRKVHLHILPTMNPDGYSLRRRGNANNVDLNRDFPDQFFHLNNILDLRQPETKAVMMWVRKKHFTASASLHGGALVANYPWDGSRDSRKEYHACPDDMTFRKMASVYSHSHHNMSLSNEFLGGITNGAFWYPIYGGMQDWNYIHGGCFELTLEISDNKWPKANELETLWEFNRMSMLNLVAWTAKTGLHGRILSSATGRPLPASVIIKGIDYKVNASTIFGDYHRMLAPGKSYEVIASMPGFQSKTTHILLEDGAMNLDFVLDPDEEPTQRVFLGNTFDCSCDNQHKFALMDFLRGFYLHISFISFAILSFIFFLVKKRRLHPYCSSLPRDEQPCFLCGPTGAAAHGSSFRTADPSWKDRCLLCNDEIYRTDAAAGMHLWCQESGSAAHPLCARLRQLELEQTCPTQNASGQHPPGGDQVTRKLKNAGGESRNPDEVARVLSKAKVVAGKLGRRRDVLKGAGPSVLKAVLAVVLGVLEMTS